MLTRGGIAEGRLTTRPSSPTRASAPGLYSLGLARERDTLLYVPKGYEESRPAPLAVMLHGAGGIAQHGMSLLSDLADAAGLVVLAPVPILERAGYDVTYHEFDGPHTVPTDIAREAVEWFVPLDG
jgi:poly(3-hydroxybutyrate) depolymerase